MTINNNLYPHVHERFRHIVSASNEERIAFLDEPRWLHYGVAEEIMQILISLMTRTKRPRMPNLLLIGDPNNGKTSLIRKFYDSYGQPYVKSTAEGVRPIILAESPPSASEKDLYISLLECFYVPYRPSDTTVKLRYQTIRMFQEFHVNMLIIDEFHSLLTGTARQQRLVMNAIKMLCNTLQIPIVGVGTRDAVRVLHTDPQHASRFDVAELPMWKKNYDFQKLIHDFQNILPLKKESHMQSPECVNQIYDISGGNLGNVQRLIVECAKHAIKTGTEQITMDIVKKHSWIQPTKGLRKIM